MGGGAMAMLHAGCTTIRLDSLPLTFTMPAPTAHTQRFPSRRARAWVLSLILALLVGQLITVIIAWVCAEHMLMFPVPTGQRPTWASRLSVPADVMYQQVGDAYYEGFGTRYRSTNLIAYWSPGEQRFHVRDSREDIRGASGDLLPAPSIQLVVLNLSTSTAGWPFQALFYQECPVPGAAFALLNDEPFLATPQIISEALREIGLSAPSLAQRFPFLANAHISFSRHIPITPLWPGYILNTLFWGGLFFAIEFAARFLHHRRRTRAGDCHHCGYTLAGLSKCPECGTPVPSDTQPASD